MSFQIVRKKLTPDEISLPNLRWNGDCDCVQQTPDGGTTWIDVPAADPRTAPGFRLPPLTGEDARCNAAANMIAYLRKIIAVDLTATTNWSLASALLALILLVFPGGVLIDLLLIIGDVILTIGSSTISTAFTEDVYDGLLCIYYCQLDADGQMTSDGLAAIAIAIESQYPGTVYDVWFVHNRMLFENGWNNAGVTGSETGDCDDCPDCAPVELAIWDDGSFVYGADLVDEGGGYWSVSSVFDGDGNVWCMLYGMNPDQHFGVPDSTFSFDFGEQEELGQWIGVWTTEPNHDAYEHGTFIDHTGYNEFGLSKGVGSDPEAFRIRFRIP